MKSRFTTLTAIGFLVAFIVIFAAPHTASAQLVDAPEVAANSAKCARSIIITDDLYCALRYELPTFETADPPATPEAWCAYLNYQTGCITDPVDPDNPETIEPGLAYVTLYDGCTVTGDCSSATARDTGRIPRIGHALAGVYLEAGHNVTWGDSDVYLCVESSSVLFATQTSDCLKVTWAIAANDREDQREELGQFFVDELLAIEIVQSRGTNFYVENNLITTDGKTLVIEALNVADRILSVFRTSAPLIITDPFATATAVVPVQSLIDSTVTSITFGATTASYTGGSASAGGVIFTLICGFIAFIATFRWIQRNSSANSIDTIIPAALVFMTVVICGFAMSEVDFSVIAVFIVIMAAPAALYVVRKIAPGN